MAAITTRVVSLLAQLGGLAILAGTLAAAVALAYRWYAREAVPRGLALLVGLSGVAIYLNTTTALGQVLGGAADPAATEVALFNIAAFATGAAGAALGRRAGDRFADDTLFDGDRAVDEDVSRLVRAVGRVITVELPQDIDDTVGYDPVPEATKEKLAGKTFVFPRRLTLAQLRERLVERITTDYAVGHVDIELAEDGSVEYLALGSRAAGIGPTLPPATNAVAVRADPAFAASAGDLVQVWDPDSMRRVLTAELRGVSGDVATIAIDASDTPKVDPTTEYRLVTLPVEDRPDREFASLLRAADETFSSVTVEAGSPLHGLPVGALDLTVVVVKPEEGDPVPIPARDRMLEPGDMVFAIASPDALRRLETAAERLDPSLVREAGRRRAGPPPGEPPGGSEPAPAGAGAAGEFGGPPAQQSASAPASGGPAEADPDSAVAEDSERDSVSASDADEPGEPGPAGPDGTAEADAGVPEEASTEGTPESEDPLAAGSDAEADEDSGERDSGEGSGDEGGSDAADDGMTSPGQADSTSFQELKSEFESGEADWGPDAEAEAESEAATGEDEGDGLGNLDVGDEETGGAPDEAAGIDRSDESEAADDTEVAFEDDAGGAFEDDEVGEETGEDDSPLSDLSFDEETDEDDSPLSDLSFEGDDDGTGGGENDEEGTDGEDDETGDGEGGDEDDEDGEDDEEGTDGDDGDDGGGNTSFQQLKEEFESGEADWEDDISDSPGGDMRLDE